MSKSCPPACCAAPIESVDELRELLSHQLFKAMGDPNRIRLLLLIIERCRTCTVSELAECLTVDVSVVSRHLALLRAAGILHAERDGKQVNYSLQYKHLAETLRGIADAIEACAPKRAAPVSLVVRKSKGRSVRGRK
jgi:DNA-binding transcriptional ArsR family regulator